MSSIEINKLNVNFKSKYENKYFAFLFRMVKRNIKTWTGLSHSHPEYDSPQAENFSSICSVSLHTACHYHPSTILLCLKYYWKKDVKARHPFVPLTAPSMCSASPHIPMQCCLFSSLPPAPSTYPTTTSPHLPRKRYYWLHQSQSRKYVHLCNRISQCCVRISQALQLMQVENLNWAGRRLIFSLHSLSLWSPV